MSEFDGLKVTELRKKARELGVATTGTRDVLLARVKARAATRPAPESFFALRSPAAKKPRKNESEDAEGGETQGEKETETEKMDVKQGTPKEEPANETMQGCRDAGKDNDDDDKSKSETTTTKISEVPMTKEEGAVGALVADFPEGEWREALAGEFAKPYFARLAAFVAAARARGPVYPPPGDVFSAFRCTPLGTARVLLLGQDPYIRAGEAHGLCFSVRRGVRVPPSLQRVYTVLERTVPGFQRPPHGCLEAWAHRGVFMLNTVLTVDAGRSNSHKGAGWETFTDAAIRCLCARASGLVAILWGRPAQKKAPLVAGPRHVVLQGPHPSPLAGNAFLSCTHFSDTNKALVEMGLSPIDWSLPP